MSVSSSHYPDNISFEGHYHTTTSTHGSLPETPLEPVTTEPNPTRQCSIRGCSTRIPVDSGTKMCETCRGRHRMYANTKRAKRKMEKAAINSHALDDNVSSGEGNMTVWMPISPSVNSVVSPSQSAGSEHSGRQINERVTSSDSLHTPPAPAWNHSALDPRLFTNSSSELAGALTLPTPLSNECNSQLAAAQPVTQTTVNAQASPSASHESGSPIPNDPDVHDIDSNAGPTSSLPRRFCSVKGCKATIPGDYFFKMCEPCRDRYRAYGTTKRAKWKNELVLAKASLESLQEKEDKRRLEAGLPPLAESSLDEYHAWEKTLASEAFLVPNERRPHLPPRPVPLPVLPARMCTVSHCYKILPGHYKFRRCVEHRKQNRYHSNLKRVREKERKAKGVGEWNAWMPPEIEATTGKKGENDTAEESPHTGHDRDSTADDPAPGSKSPKLHPAAKGVRRTNHICSVKACFNLLSPGVPWKMCETCRARDRTIRKNRRLREQGKLNAERDNESQTFDNPVAGGLAEDSDDDEAVSDHPEEPEPASTASLDQEVSVTPQVAFMNLSQPSDLTATTNASVSKSNSIDVDATSKDTMVADTSPEVAPSPPKRRGKNTSKEPKNKETQQPSESAKDATNNSSPDASAASHKPSTSNVKEPTASTSTPPAPNPALGPYPYIGPIPTQYQVPYYMPPAYGIPPYGYPHFQPPQSDPPSSDTSKPPSSAQPHSQHPYPQYPAHPYSHMVSYPPPPFGAPPPYPPGPYGYFPPHPYIQPHYGYPPPPPPPPPPPTPKPPVKAKPLRLPAPPKPVVYSMAHPKFYVPNIELRRKRRKISVQPAAADAATTTDTGPISVTTVNSIPTLKSMTSTFKLDIAGRNGPLIPTPSPTNLHNIQPTDPKDASNAVDQPTIQPVPSYSTIEMKRSEVRHSQRQCSGKTCHRTIPFETSGAFCGRCRARIKKHQAKVKQRFRLEPRKFVGRASGNNQKGDGGYDTGDDDEEEVIGLVNG